MKIAVTYDSGEVYQHFGHSEYFKIYDTENGKVTGSEVVATDGTGHGALAGFLKERGADVLICGGIGGGAIAALSEAGIKVYPGASGSADGCVGAFLAGTLDYDPDTRCSHHKEGEGHACASEGDSASCASHGQGHGCKNSCR